MKLSIRDCSLLDILSVYGAVCDDERQQIAALGYSPDDSDVAATVWKCGGTRFCLCETETLAAVAVFGVYYVAPGNYRAWMFAAADAFEKYGPEITMNVGHVVVELFKQLEANRFELLALARRLHARVWYAKLGFVKEATRQGLGNEQFVLYTYRGEKT